MNFVVAVYTRGRWHWLRVIKALEIDHVTTPATTITLELGDRQGATTWGANDREDATAHARIVKGLVVRDNWKPKTPPARMAGT